MGVGLLESGDRQVIRPDAEEIIRAALREAPTRDGQPVCEHVHLISVSGAIIKAFAAEGVDLEAAVDELLDAQTITIKSAT